MSISPEARVDKVDNFLDNIVKDTKDIYLSASKIGNKIFDNFCKSAKNQAEFEGIQNKINDLINGTAVTVTSGKALSLDEKEKLQEAMTEAMTKWNKHLATITKPEEDGQKAFLDALSYRNRLVGENIKTILTGYAHMHSEMIQGIAASIHAVRTAAHKLGEAYLA